MKSIFYFLVLLTLCTACTSGHQSPPYTRMAHQIMNQVAKEVEKTEDLRLIGSGGGMMYNVNMLAMTFVHYGELDVGTGRNLIIRCTEALLHAVNTNEKIRPYLSNYPFEEKNIEMMIAVCSTDGSKIPDGSICIVNAAFGEVEWNVRDGPLPLKTIYKEPYQVALEKAKAQ